jgi:hypothetical protein
MPNPQTLRVTNTCPSQQPSLACVGLGLKTKPSKNDLFSKLLIAIHVA